MTFKKIFFSFAILLSLVSWAHAQGQPAPKCEKCYRGPDGKVVCEPVPCPDKTKK